MGFRVAQNPQSFKQVLAIGKFRAMHEGILCRGFVLICANDVHILPILLILPIEKSTTYLFSTTSFVVPFQNRSTVKAKLL
jgi:hypothetical protein